jgi:hypothetical protein
VVLGTLGIGCILGSASYFIDRAVLTLVNRFQPSAQSLDVKHPAATGSLNTVQEIAGVPRTDDLAARAARVAAQRPERQPRAAKSFPAASSAERKPKPSAKPMPFPETRPITIEGWMVLDVVGGTAIVQGPDGVRRVTRGDTLPGAGSVESIVRWGNRWIVATSKGLISTP